MKRSRTPRGMGPQSGFTLIELMVTIVISMILMVIVANTYLGSRTSYRLNDTSARLQQDVHFTLANIGDQLRQAGYGKPASLSDTALVSELDAQKIEGFKACDFGFTDPSKDDTCDSGGKFPAFQVAYQVAEDLANPTAGLNQNIGAGTDCNGQQAKNPDGIAVNRYFLRDAGDGSTSLYCVGNGNTVPHPILNNVNAMYITYGVDTRAVDTTPDYLNQAGTANRYFESIADAKKATTDFDFKKVVNMTVCLDVSSPKTISATDQTYLNCVDKDPVTASDHKLHFTVKSVFALRNNSATSQLTYTP